MDWCGAKWRIDCGTREGRSFGGSRVSNGMASAAVHRTTSTTRPLPDSLRDASQGAIARRSGEVRNQAQDLGLLSDNESALPATVHRRPGDGFLVRRRGRASIRIAISFIPGAASHRARAWLSCSAAGGTDHDRVARWSGALAIRPKVIRRMSSCRSTRSIE